MQRRMIAPCFMDDTLECLRRHNVEVEPLLASVGLPPVISEPISAEQYGALWHAVAQAMDDEFFGHIKGVYFPLARFGQYVVVVKDAEGKVANVSRAETMAEADATRRQLVGAFPAGKGFTVGKVLKAKDFVADRDSVGRGFMEQLYGVLDNSFRRFSPDENRTNLGGDEWANEWPRNSAWDFVALGRGHDTAYWTEFLRALHEVDPGMLVNIEHEDVSLGRIEGLQVAAKVLRDADAALRDSLAAAR